MSTGYTAFVQSSLELDVFLDRSVIDPDGKRDRTALMTADYTLLAKKALASAVGADPANKLQMREIGALLSRDVDIEIRKAVLADPAVIGKTVPIWVLASGRVDNLMKGTLDRNLPAATRKISDQQLALDRQARRLPARWPRNSIPACSPTALRAIRRRPASASPWSARCS